MGEQQTLVEVPVKPTADASAVASGEAGPAPGKVFRNYQPGQIMLMPPSWDEWLPAEHLARFVDELVETHLELEPFYAAHTNVKGRCVLPAELSNALVSPRSATASA